MFGLREETNTSEKGSLRLHGNAGPHTSRSLSGPQASGPTDNSRPEVPPPPDSPVSSIASDSTLCPGSQGGPIQNRKSKRCLELQENSDSEFGFQLVLQRCSGQHWSITNVLRSLAS